MEQEGKSMETRRYTFEQRQRMQCLEGHSSVEELAQMVIDSEVDHIAALAAKTEQIRVLREAVETAKRCIECGTDESNYCRLTLDAALASTAPVAAKKEVE